MIFHILVNGVAMSHTIRDKQKLKARASKIQGSRGAQENARRAARMRCSFTTDCCYPWRGKRSDAGSD